MRTVVDVLRWVVSLSMNEIREISIAPRPTNPLEWLLLPVLLFIKFWFYSTLALIFLGIVVGIGTWAIYFVAWGDWAIGLPMLAIQVVIDVFVIRGAADNFREWRRMEGYKNASRPKGSDV